MGGREIGSAVGEARHRPSRDCGAPADRRGARPVAEPVVNRWRRPPPARNPCFAGHPGERRAAQPRSRRRPVPRDRGHPPILPLAPGAGNPGDVAALKRADGPARHEHVLLRAEWQHILVPGAVAAPTLVPAPAPGAPAAFATPRSSQPSSPRRIRPLPRPTSRRPRRPPISPRGPFGTAPLFSNPGFAVPETPFRTGQAARRGPRRRWRRGPCPNALTRFPLRRCPG